MRRCVYVCAALVCAVAGAVVSAQQEPTTQPPAESPYAACVHAHSGRIRVIDAVEACRPNETRIDWTITGTAEEPIILPSGKPQKN